MIVWRGWGILTVVVAALGVGLGSALAAFMGQTGPFMIGVGLVLAAIGNWFVGNYFNVQRPQVELTRFMTDREATLAQLVQQGCFSRGPGYPAPQSLADAQAQAQQQLAEDRAELRKRMRNGHALFWIPMQYFSIVLAGIGAIAMIAGFAS